MENFKKYYLFAVFGTLAASFYPFYMGGRVLWDMIKEGTVLGENYPKYIIPYTPVALAVFIGVLLMPVLFRLAQRFALFAASVASISVFFLSEILLERQVTVTTTGVATLESWQMFMCYIPREYFESHTKTAVEILMGDYNPAFKLHFYLISIVLILILLNCFYGFAKMIREGDFSRKNALILQSAAAAVFLGLCILACFTAFFRDGEIQVSPLSAVLMVSFFLLFGVTIGIYAGSFLLGRKKMAALLIPAVLASAGTAAMYAGEMILLDGHLYRFGTGFFFEGLGDFVFAPADLCVILFSGVGCALLLAPFCKEK